MSMRVALTGGATGIGAAVASKLTGAGHHVTAFDITEPSQSVDRWIETDLSDPASITAAVDAAEGPFDALINNAGLPPRDGLAEKILIVNFLGFRAFSQAMRTKLAPGATIVNVASRAGAMWREHIDEVKALMALRSNDEVAGFVANRGIDPTRAYNLSKEAVIVQTIADTEGLIANGFRANSVSPSAVSTGILDDFVTAFGDRAKTSIERAGRPGTPEEIADLIAFLASPESHWIKGQDILIDGGISAMMTSDMMGLNQG